VRFIGLELRDLVRNIRSYANL